MGVRQALIVTRQYPRSKRDDSIAVVIIQEIGECLFPNEELRVRSADEPCCVRQRESNLGYVRKKSIRFTSLAVCFHIGYASGSPYPKVKLSTERPSHRTIASMPSTSIRPPSLVRVSVETLTPISFATCDHDIPRDCRC